MSNEVSDWDEMRIKVDAILSPFCQIGSRKEYMYANIGLFTFAFILCIHFFCNFEELIFLFYLRQIAREYIRNMMSKLTEN